MPDIFAVLILVCIGAPSAANCTLMKREPNPLISASQCSAVQAAMFATAAAYAQRRGETALLMGRRCLTLGNLLDVRT